MKYKALDDKKSFDERVAEEFLEELAGLEHDRWSRWHRYSRLMATPKNVKMWDRKAEMLYKVLTNEEQESDREEARITMGKVKAFLRSEIAAVLERVVLEKAEYPEHECPRLTANHPCQWSEEEERNQAISDLEHIKAEIRKEYE